MYAFSVVEGGKEINWNGVPDHRREGDPLKKHIDLRPSAGRARESGGGGACSELRAVTHGLGKTRPQWMLVSGQWRIVLAKGTRSVCYLLRSSGCGRAPSDISINGALFFCHSISMKTPVGRDETSLLSSELPITLLLTKCGGGVFLDKGVCPTQTTRCKHLARSMWRVACCPRVWWRGPPALGGHFFGSSLEASRYRQFVSGSSQPSTEGFFCPRPIAIHGRLQSQRSAERWKSRDDHRGVCRGAVGRRRSHLHAAADAHRTCSRHADR
jgi:hypothetical protein